MEELKLTYHSDSVKNLAIKIVNSNYDELKKEDNNFMQLYKLIWRDSGIQYCFFERGYNILCDNAG